MGCFSVHKAKRKIGVGVGVGSPLHNNSVAVEEQPVPEPSVEVAAGEEIENLASAATDNNNKNNNKNRAVLSAPPSFRSRVKAIQNVQRFITSNPGFLQSQHEEPDENGSPALPPAAVPSPVLRASKSYGHGHGHALARPMPLPSPSLSSSSSFSSNLSGYRLPLPQHQKQRALSQPLDSNVASSLYGSVAMMAPSASSSSKGKRNSADELLKPFTHEEISLACRNFSPDFCLGESGNSSYLFHGVINTEKKGGENQATEVDILRCCEKRMQGYKEWISDLSQISQICSSNLSRLIGWYAEEGSLDRVLVYERLPGSGNLENGSFRSINNGLKGEAIVVDWPSRVKIAMGAAQAFIDLNDSFPNMVPFREFRMHHIQVDSGFSVRLSGYAMDGTESGNGGSEREDEEGRCPPEMVQRVSVSMKSNVWCFGIVLLELVTGRVHMDPGLPFQERNLVKWSRPFVHEESRLFLAMDPKLHGKFPLKGAKMVIDLALHCLHQDPLSRPSMHHICEHLRSVLDMRYNNNNNNNNNNNGTNSTSSSFRFHSFSGNLVLSSNLAPSANVVPPPANVVPISSSLRPHPYPRRLGYSQRVIIEEIFDDDGKDDVSKNRHAADVLTKHPSPPYDVITSPTLEPLVVTPTCYMPPPQYVGQVQTTRSPRLSF